MLKKEHYITLIFISMLFTIESFNRVFSLNLHLSNFINIILFGVILLLFVRILLGVNSQPSPIYFIFIIPLFLSGINLQSKPKLFLFLFAFYGSLSVYLFLSKRKDPSHSVERIQLIIASVLSLTTLVLIFTGLMKIIILLLLAFLLLGIELIHLYGRRHNLSEIFRED